MASAFSFDRQCFCSPVFVKQREWRHRLWAQDCVPCFQHSSKQSFFFFSPSPNPSRNRQEFWKASHFDLGECDRTLYLHWVSNSAKISPAILSCQHFPIDKKYLVWTSGEFYWRMKHHFPENSGGKEDNFARFIQIFGNFLPVDVQLCLFHWYERKWTLSS